VVEHPCSPATWCPEEMVTFRDSARSVTAPGAGVPASSLFYWRSIAGSGFARYGLIRVVWLAAAYFCTPHSPGLSETVTILVVSACLPAERGSGVAQRCALGRRIARGHGLAASPSYRTATLHALVDLENLTRSAFLLEK
jgi:hypothetical protein